MYMYTSVVIFIALHMLKDSIRLQLNKRTQSASRLDEDESIPITWSYSAEYDVALAIF